MPFALQRLSVQLWMAIADEAQRAIGAASRGRELWGEARAIGGTHAGGRWGPPARRRRRFFRITVVLLVKLADLARTRAKFVFLSAQQQPEG